MTVSTKGKEDCKNGAGGDGKSHESSKRETSRSNGCDLIDRAVTSDKAVRLPGSNYKTGRPHGSDAPTNDRAMTASATTTIHGRLTKFFADEGPSIGRSRYKLLQKINCASEIINTNEQITECRAANCCSDFPWVRTPILTNTRSVPKLIGQDRSPDPLAANLRNGHLWVNPALRQDLETDP